MKHKMFRSFILTLLLLPTNLLPLANSSCDPTACKIGTSAGSGVCQVGAAIGGVVAAAACTAGAVVTFGLSCLGAAVTFAAAGGGCAVAGGVVTNACNYCASDDAPDFQETANKLDGIEQALVENRLKQEAWFQQLVKNDKNIILGQAKMISLQQTTMGQLRQLINTTDTLGHKIDHSQIITLYGDAFHHVSRVREKFDLLNRGPSGLIVNDHRAEKFRDAALRHNTRSEDSINTIFEMLSGGHTLKKGSIYETLGDKFCKPEIHKYFLDVLIEALTMHATALAMEGDTLSPRLSKNFNEDIVKATSAYNRHCDCAPGLQKANRGQVSTLLDRLPSASQNLNKNRGIVARMENNVMRIKMDLIFAVKNFEPNKIAESILERHSVEDIELIVASVKNMKEGDLELHDSADICVDEEKNTVKTSAAFTPDSFVNGCVPPQTLEHGRFLCLEDGVTCHVVCEKGYYQRLPQTFMECLDNAWTPLPTSFKCEVICPHKDDLSDVLLENNWRTQNQIFAMSEDDQRNTVIVEVEKMTGHTIEDLQGRANSGDLGSLTAIANMAALLIKYSIKSSCDVKTMTYEPHLRNTLIIEISKRFQVSTLQGLTDRQLLYGFCAVKTSAAFTPDSFVNGCVPPQTLDHGRFLCLEDGVKCHVVCDEDYYLEARGSAIVSQRFMKCLDNIWTPLPTTFKCASPTCSGGATLLSTSPGGDMVLCKDKTRSTCQKDFESLCPAGWNLCTPGQFNNRNHGWDYNWEDANAGYPQGVIYCEVGYGRARHYAIYNNPVLNTDERLNCRWASSRPGCERFAGVHDCKRKDDSALCCAPTRTCGDGLVQQEEDCDDGNDSNMDDCLNSCTWYTPREHGLSGC